MAISPTAEGFRAAFRRPSLTLAEISWRWCTGATATALFFFGFFEYLSTLPVTKGELLLLRSRQPYLIGQALAHILRGTLGRVAVSGLLAALLLSLLWMVAGALGRVATVRGLLDYFRNDAADNGATRNGPHSLLHPIIRLNFLRISVTVAAVFGFVGASIIAGFASPDSHPRPGLAFILFLPLAGLVWLVWTALNWLLSLAGMFAARGGEDAVDAISSAVALCRERTGAVAAVSTWTGLAHLTAFVGATTLVSMPLGFIAVVPWRLVVAVMILITLAYFALADWLYMARLAGYVCIAEMPEALLAPIPPLPAYTPPSAPPAPPVETAIDRDELILSDIPSPASG